MISIYFLSTVWLFTVAGRGSHRDRSGDSSEKRYHVPPNGRHPLASYENPLFCLNREVFETNPKLNDISSPSVPGFESWRT